MCILLKRGDEVLENKIIRLEPLALHHAEALAKAADDERIWAMTQPRMRSVEDATNYIQFAIEAPDQQAYAIFSKLHDQFVGATRFYTIDENFGSAEMGYTWLNPIAWHTAVNTNVKYLMLIEAFEARQYKRLQIMADTRNTRSRRAIERIGATFEGILRKHKWGADGAIRDSAVYSVIDDEWPQVKAHIEKLL